MVYYMRKTGASIFREETVDKFEILDANYYVTLLDGVTVVYTPQNLQDGATTITRIQK